MIKMSRITNLREILNEIPVTKHDLEAASKTFDAPYIAEKTAQLRELISSIEEAIKDSSHCPAEGYKTIVVDMAERGNFAGALEIAAKIISEHTQSEAYNSLLSAMVEKEGLDSLVSVVDEIESHYCKARAYVILASAQSDAGQKDKVEQSFKSALKLLKKSKAEQYDKQEAIAELATAQAKAGMYKQAMKVARSISCSFLSSKDVKILTKMARAEAHDGISIAMAERGDFDQAFDVVTKYLSGSDQNNTCNRLLSLQVKAGKDSEALKTAELMKKNDDLGHLADGAYSSIINYQLERGDIDAAKETARLFGPKKYKHSMAMGLAKAGKCDEAIEIIKEFPDQFSPASHVYLTIAVSRANEGDYEGALDACELWGRHLVTQEGYRHIATIMAKRNDFDEALELAEKLPDPIYKVSTYCHIASHMARAGEVDMAKQTFGLALKAGKTKRGERTKDTYYGFIAAAQAKAGFIEDADKTLANNVSYPSAIVETALPIELAKADAGDFDGAITSLNSLLSVTDSISTRNRNGHRVELMKTCYQVMDKISEAQLK